MSGTFHRGSQGTAPPRDQGPEADVLEATRPEVEPCPAGDVLDQLGDTWTLLVLSELAAGPRRVNTLTRAVPGLSQVMLMGTLQRLERDGLISRTVRPTTPRAVEYALTDLGRSFGPPVAALLGWAWQRAAEVMAARQRYDGRCA